MRTISDAMKDWKAEEGQKSPIVVLFDIEVDDVTTLRLVQGNPSGTGSVTYDGNVYTAAAIDLQDVEETIESDLRDRQLSVSNIDGIAAGYIETKDLEGRRVTITTVLYSTMAPADAVVETYTMQDQRYDRQAASVTLGHASLFKRKIPWRRFERPRCQWAWEHRFLHDSECGYPSDVFGPDTAQDLVAGGITDGEQVRKHGWSTLNVLQADRMDVDSPNVPDQLYIESTSAGISWSGSTRGGPYIYKRIVGDFDVFTQIELFDTRTGSLAGFLVQEAVAGQDSWVMWGKGENVESDLVARLAAAIDGVQQPDSDTVVTGDTYLRLRRVGNVFTFYYANDVDVLDPEAGWTLAATKTFALDADQRVGFVLAASSAESARVAAGFRFIRFLAGGLPTCSRLMDGADGCREHGNAVHFGAHPGIPRR